MQEEADRFYPQLLAAWKRSISGDKFPSGNDCVREIGIAAAYVSAIGIPSIVFFHRSINRDNPSARLHNHQRRIMENPRGHHLNKVFIIAK